MDATLRMLNTSELQQAQGFPVDYVFLGTKTEQCKQIGNAVPVNLARAVTLAAIS
jgi:DNA (cytosine-5)-methyltransferase 1